MVLIPGLSDDMARECLIRLPYNYFPKIKKVSKYWKEEVKSSEFHRRRKAGCFTQTIIVLIQNTSFFTLYEPLTGVWSHLPLAPDSIMLSECDGVGHKIVVMSWKHVWIYDFVSDKWKSKNSIPFEEPVQFFASAAGSFDSDSDSVLKRKELVFVAGGLGVKEASRCAAAYDIENYKWVPMPDMARIRYSCKGMFNSGTGKFMVLGGETNTTCTSMEIFDVATWKWEKVVKNMLLGPPKFSNYCFVENQGKMYRCMALNINTSSCVIVVEILNDANEWKKVANISPPPDADYKLASMQPPYMLSCQENLYVLVNYWELDDHRDNNQPRLSPLPHWSIYKLETKGYMWNKVNGPDKQHTRYVYSGCCLEI